MEDREGCGAAWEPAKPAVVMLDSMGEAEGVIMWKVESGKWRPRSGRGLIADEAGKLKSEMRKLVVFSMGKRVERVPANPRKSRHTP